MKKYILYTFLLFTQFSATAQNDLKCFDVYTGQSSAFAQSLTVYNDRLYFYAMDGVNGQEVWSIDSTNNPAVMLADINPSPQAWHVWQDQRAMSVVNNELYFWAKDGVHYGVYSYNTVTAPTLKTDLLPLHSGFAEAKMMTQLGNRIVFVGIYNYGSPQVWSYDVTTNAANKVTDIPGSLNQITDLTEGFGNDIYFTSNDGGGVNTLFIYNPASGITQPFEDVHPDDTIRNAVSFRKYGNEIYFYGSTSGMGPDMGFYRIDSTFARECISCKSGLPIKVEAALGSTIVKHNSDMYYVAVNSNKQAQIIRFNSITQKSSVVFTNQVVSTPIRSMCMYKDKLYFAGADTEHGTELWQYDGSTTKLIADLQLGSNSSSPNELTVMGNSLYFTAFGNKGIEVYKYNNTPIYTGVQMATFDASVTTYPNPAHDATTLDITLGKPQTFSITLTDVQGREVYNVPATAYTATQHSIKIPMQQLAAGTYFYRIANEKVLASGQVVKE